MGEYTNRLLSNILDNGPDAYESEILNHLKNICQFIDDNGSFGINKAIVIFVMTIFMYDFKNPEILEWRLAAGVQVASYYNGELKSRLDNNKYSCKNIEDL